MHVTAKRRVGSGLVWAGCSLFVLVALAASPAQADLVTYQVSFTANNFQIGSGGNPPPVDPVTGSATLTFDPTVSVTNSTANITLNSLNIALGSAIAFSYDPAVANGRLTIGGINAGAGTIIFNPSTNDFWLFVNNLTTTPTFDQVGYTQTAVSSNNLFFTLNQTGSVNVSAVPEPSTLALGGLALAPVVAMIRRRKAAKSPRRGSPTRERG